MSSFGNDPNQPPNYGAPPPPPPPPAYGAPPTPYTPQSYGMPASAANPFESKQTTILVLGILSLVLCQILGPVAWIMGNNLKKEAAAAGYPEPGQAKAGRICGIVATALMVLGILFFVLVLVIAAGSSST